MAVGGSSLKFLGGLLVAAVAVLLVLLWRSTPDPTVSAAQPAPQSTVLAGPTMISAEILGVAPLHDVALLLDGDRVNPVLSHLSASHWRITYRANIEPGTHRAEVIAHDIHERGQRFDWRFSVAADLAPPQITDVLPVPGRHVAPGQIEFGATILDRSPLAAATLRVAGRVLALQIAPTTGGSAADASLPSQRLIARTSLPAGSYQVELVVRDSGGQTADYSWQVIVAGTGA